MKGICFLPLCVLLWFMVVQCTACSPHWGGDYGHGQGMRAGVGSHRNNMHSPGHGPMHGSPHMHGGPGAYRQGGGFMDALFGTGRGRSMHGQGQGHGHRHTSSHRHVHHKSHHNHQKPHFHHHRKHHHHHHTPVLPIIAPIISPIVHSSFSYVSSYNGNAEWDWIEILIVVIIIFFFFGILYSFDEDYYYDDYYYDEYYKKNLKKVKSN